MAYFRSFGRFILAVLSGLILLWALVGCTGGESKVVSGTRDGVLHFGNTAEPQGLDPHVVTGVPENRIITALFEGLVQKNASTLDPEPAAAESWTIDDAGTLYTFHIRKNARWSNGDPVTAHDFVWSWWRALQPALGSQYVFMYFSIKNAEAYFRQEITDFSEVGIKAVDDHTLTVELNNPTPYFLQLLDHYSMYPVHRPTIEKFGRPDESYTRWTRPGNMVSNGPFVLSEWRLYKYLSILKNPGYWGHKDVKLNEIRYYPIDQVVTEERMFRARQLHITRDVPLDRIPWYRENHPELIRIEPYIGTYMYRINTNKPQLADLRVRRALAMTIDRKTLIDTVLNGIYTPAYSITPPGLSGYQPPKVFSYDPDGARKLMAEAGYPNGKGYPGFELQYNSNEAHRKIAIALQQMWKSALNIDVQLRNKDWKVYLNDETTGNYEVSRGGWIGDYVDPSTFIDMWTSDSGVNRTGFADPDYDELVLQKAPQSSGTEERWAHYFAAEKLLMDDMPILPIYTYSDKRLIHPDVKGLPANYMAYFNFRNIELVQSDVPAVKQVL